MNKIHNTIQNIISTSVILVYIIPVSLFIYTGDTIHIKAFVGSFITILTEYVKHRIGKKNPRPDGALDCNMWCNNGDVSGKPGMPSGHSVSSAFFAGFYFQNTNNVWIKSMLVMYAGLVMISRYMKKCHTIGQIGTGATIGIIFSWIMNHIPP